MRIWRWGPQMCESKKNVSCFALSPKTRAIDMKLDTDRHTWGGDAECFMGINSYERLEHHSNNARLGKSDGYPRLPKNISIRHHPRKWQWLSHTIPRRPIQKWVEVSSSFPVIFVWEDGGFPTDAWRISPNVKRFHFFSRSVNIQPSSPIVHY